MEVVDEGFLEDFVFLDAVVFAGRVEFADAGLVEARSGVDAVLPAFSGDVADAVVDDWGAERLVIGWPYEKDGHKEGSSGSF